MKAVKVLSVFVIAIVAVLVSSLLDSCGKKPAPVAEATPPEKVVVVQEKERVESICALRDALWKYASEHQGKMPENSGAKDFPAHLWKAPDKLGSPYVYLAPDSWGFWRMEPSMEDVTFGYFKRPEIRGTGTYDILVGDTRRYILVCEPPVFDGFRFVVTSTGHVLRLKAAELATRIGLEASELYDETKGAHRSADHPDPFKGGVVPGGPSEHAKALVSALRYWSSDRQGNYPRQIEDVVRQGIVEPDTFYNLNWHEWTPGRVGPWIYVVSLTMDSTGMTDSSSGDLPLLISPPLSDGSRIVAFNSSEVKQLSAADFRGWVEKWKKMFGEMKEPWPAGLEGL